MPILFKLIGCNNTKPIEIIRAFTGELRLSNIHSIFEIYGLMSQDLEEIKFVGNSESIKTNDKVFLINEKENFVIFVFTSNKEVKEKLISIFSDNGEKIPLLIKKEVIIDEELTKSIDTKEIDIVHELDDKTVNNMNIKTIKLFNNPDFKHLVRIYYSNQDIMKEFFSYIVSGDITKLTVNKTEKNYEDEIQILQSLGITDSTENIQKCLESVNGHLNLALRLLLCKSSLLE
jgi:hypothetical protein